MKLEIIMLGVTSVSSVTMDLSVQGVSITDLKFKVHS